MCECVVRFVTRHELGIPTPYGNIATRERARLYCIRIIEVGV